MTNNIRFIKAFPMKKISLYTLFTILACSVFAQNNPKRIKIILLGTFHFNQSLDSTSRLHSNLFSEKRQKEIEDIVAKLVSQKPDKIFLEFTPNDQHYYDSVYLDYRNGKEPLRLKTKANEIFQLGMKTAKQLGHSRVIGINYQPEELEDSTYKAKNEVDKAIQRLYHELGSFNDTTRTNAAFYDLPYPYKMLKQDSLLQKSSLKEFLIQLNSDKTLQKAEYSEWNYFLSMGTGADMSSTNYVGTFWYGTNLQNFNNVLRQVDYKKDTCYLLIYGSNHILFLKYLFQLNPYFEVVDLNEVLK